jgi:cell fate regulator YaaT (PSP1 superfamily)
VASLIEVSFKGNRREFFTWDNESVPEKNTAIIVEADRGEDLGYVHATGDAAVHRSKGVPHGTGGELPQRKARRFASNEDVKRHNDLRAQDDEARRKAQERVRANALAMKVSDAEWQWDRKKLTFYFTAEKRVDFRTLVRELAATFRTRIELKQIGVRDEAKRLDGIGRCGRQYCSASWLPELRPVSLGVAKDQRLSLNPTQISGACGRLMCSLRYEHEFYVQARRRFPKEGKSVRTTVGEEKVISNDIFRERVVLRSGEGEVRTIPLAQLLEESAAAGGTIVPAVSGRRFGAPETAVERLPEDADDDSREEGDTNAEQLTEEVSPPSSGVSSAPSPASASAVSTSSQPEQRPEAKPHRRRGRRGGRRNRGGRRDGGPGEGTSGEGNAPQ